MVDLTEADYVWVLKHEEGEDFEDALQLAMALRAGCDRFMTLDKKFAAAYGDEQITFFLPV